MGDDTSVQGNLEINKKDNSVTVSVNPKVYPLDVIMSSAYIFTDRNFVFVDGDVNEEILVEIRPKKEKGNLERTGREFNNELINYANYAVQAIKNHGMREAVLNRVLMTNNPPPQHHHEGPQPEDSHQQPSDCYEQMQYDSPEEGSWDFDDPEGIAVPWEEKYGKEDSGKETAPAENSDEKVGDDFNDPLGIAVPWEEKFGKEDSAPAKSPESDDFEDPLGIAVPWEEKYGKDAKGGKK